MAHGIAGVRCCLPIYSARDALLREIGAHECCVVVGETGSGKTTQIPQYILESGLNKGLAIACTQPRRVAAISVAKRVVEERGGRLGEEVGYSVRFDDCSCPSTKLRYMTDGMLLREAISDPLLMRYSLVILDEAHERTVHTDVLFGVVKAAQRERGRGKGRLRVIVMSATLAAEEFSRYFNNGKILYIQGRQYPVEVHYTLTPQPDYLHSAITTVLQLHEEKGRGDILVFLTGREEIEAAQRILQQCRRMFPTDWPDVVVCPLYAALPTKQQQKVFVKTPEGCRKVILSTNIAETSITIPGVTYVVDTGVVKAKGYNPQVGLDLLCVQPVSKAQARQRAGRAGREGPGACYRLYTEQSFDGLDEDTIPEIQRCNLSSVVLQLLALGIRDILGFEFMDPPSHEALVKALEQLYLLGAVERREEGGGIRLTALGEQMAHFPLEPHLSRAILASQELCCSEDVLSVVAMLTVDSVLYSPPHGHKAREEAVAAWSKFSSPEGDHIMMLNIYKAYKSVNGNKHWCYDNYIHIRNMKTVLAVRGQLRELCTRLGITLTSSGSVDVVLRCLLSGLFTNVAEHVGEGKYQSISSRQEVLIHPSSCLFHVKPHPQCLLYSELVHTSKCYMRAVSVLDSDWLVEVAPTYFRRKR